MTRRPTYKAALRLARETLADIDCSSPDEDTRAGQALHATANPLPIDMAQLAKLANAFFKVGKGELGPRDAACHSIDEFLKFCKENAK